MVFKPVGVDENGQFPPRVKTTLNATYGRSRQAILELNEDFTNVPDGVPTTAQTGQAIVYSPTTAQDSLRSVRIKSGYLTMDPLASPGGYRGSQLDGSVIRLGASVAFDAGDSNGLACLAVWETAFDYAGAIPRSPCHLIVSPDNWSYGVFDTVGSTLRVILSGNFAVALPTDGSTLSHFEAVIDGKAGIAYVTLPDGSIIKTPQDDAIKLPARWVTPEPFRLTAGAGNALAKFRTLWADSRDTSAITATKRAYLAWSTANTANHPTTQTTYLPGSGVNQNLALTASYQAVPGTSTTFTVPASGAVSLRLGAMLDITTDTLVNLGIWDSGDALIAVRSVASKIAHGGFVTLELALGGLTPGTSKTIRMAAQAGASSAAAIWVNQTGSNYFGPSITVQNL